MNFSANRTSPSKPSAVRDILGIAGFVLAVVLGALFLNNFVFQSYNVEGPSMEPTLQTGDRLLVNKVSVSLARLQGNQWLPERGTVIVFQNPRLGAAGEQHLVKRVIGLPGERVVVEKGAITVYNSQHPKGFNPDETPVGPKQPTEGNVDITVPEDEVFVAGDNRVGQFSFDSRNGLSTIPLELVEGPVSARVFPFTKWRWF